MGNVTLPGIGVYFDDLAVQTRQTEPGGPNVTGAHGDFIREDNDSVTYNATDASFTGSDWAFVSLLNSSTGFTILDVTLACNVTSGQIVKDSDWLALRRAFCRWTLTGTTLKIRVLNAAADMSNWKFVVELPKGDGSVDHHEYTYAQFSAGDLSITVDQAVIDGGMANVKTRFVAKFAGTTVEVSGGEENIPIRYVGDLVQIPTYATDLANDSAKLHWDFVDKVPGVTKQRVTANIGGQGDGAPVTEAVTTSKTVTGLVSGMNIFTVEFLNAQNAVVTQTSINVQVS